MRRRRGGVHMCVFVCVCVCVRVHTRACEGLCDEKGGSVRWSVCLGLDTPRCTAGPRGLPLGPEALPASWPSVLLLPESSSLDVSVPRRSSVVSSHVHASLACMVSHGQCAACASLRLMYSLVCV